MNSNINASAITEEKSLQTVNADLQKLDKAGSQVKLAVSELNQYLIIADKHQQEDAMALLKLCKEVEGAIEKRRKELVTPFNNTVKQYNDYAKKLTGDLSAAIDNVKTACLKFQKQEEERILQARSTARQGALAQMGFIYEASLDLYKRDGVGSITGNEIKMYDDVQFANILSAYGDTIHRYNQQQVAQLNEEKELAEMFGDENDIADISTQIANADLNPVVAAPPVNGFKVDKLKGTTKRWTYELADFAQVPREYLIIDSVAITKAIRDGVREIPGIKIYQEESLSIR